MAESQWRLQDFYALKQGRGKQSEERNYQADAGEGNVLEQTPMGNEQP